MTAVLLAVVYLGVGAALLDAQARDHFRATVAHALALLVGLVAWPVLVAVAIRHGAWSRRG